MFCEEAVMWKRLRHPNIVPFIGITRDPMQLVSEWMPNGTLTRYINTHPTADRICLVGTQFVRDNHSLTDSVLPSYWMLQKVLRFFTRTIRYMET